MTDNTKHDAAHGSYEHQDLTPTGIVYFLVALAVAVILSLLFLRAVYSYLDHREKAGQPAVSPLVTSPKLEEDERGQLNDILVNEEKILYSYGWVDEKAGAVHIPIERAMDLLVQRGLPVRTQGVAGSPASEAGKKESGNQNLSKGARK